MNGKRCKVILYVGLSRGNGNSTLAFNHASILSNNYKVLFIENNGMGHFTQLMFDGNKENGIYDIYTKGTFSAEKVNFSEMDHNVKLVADKQLFFATGGARNFREDANPSKNMLKWVLNEKNIFLDFDFVIIDSGNYDCMYFEKGLEIADHIVATVSPCTNALRNGKRLKEKIEGFYRRNNRSKPPLSVMLNRLRKGDTYKYIVKRILKTFKESEIINHPIYETTRVEESLICRLPIDLFHRNKTGYKYVEPFIKCSEELLARVCGAQGL